MPRGRDRLAKVGPHGPNARAAPARRAFFRRAIGRVWRVRSGTVHNAEFAATRLRSLFPRLQQRLLEVQATEYAAQWDADFQKVAAKRDAAAKVRDESADAIRKEQTRIAACYAGSAGAHSFARA